MTLRAKAYQTTYGARVGRQEFCKRIKVHNTIAINQIKRAITRKKCGESLAGIGLATKNVLRKKTYVLHNPTAPPPPSRLFPSSLRKARSLSSPQIMYMNNKIPSN